MICKSTNHPKRDQFSYSRMNGVAESGGFFRENFSDNRRGIWWLDLLRGRFFCLFKRLTKCPRH